MEQIKRFVKLSCAISAASLIAACGGGQVGTVSKTDTGYSVSGGVAQKGPLLKGSNVKIEQLDDDTFVPKASVASLATSNDTGAFDSSSAVFSGKSIQTSVEGYFFDELAGITTKETVKIEGKSDLSIDRLINVNILTTLGSKRIDVLVRDKTNRLTYHNFKFARNQAQKEVLAAFRIYNAESLMPGGLDNAGNIVPASFNELDLSNVQTGSQILAAISAVAVKAGTNEAGIKKFITDFQADVADDGLINGSVVNTFVRNSIDVASAGVDMAAVATNLNSFYHITTYTADMLKQWVDSSGGLDQVIDKYKSSVKDVAVSTEIKSPEYLAGTDDVGQCFTSSRGNLYQNGLLTNGPVKVAIGDKLVISLTESGSKTNQVGFIQRALPSSSICDATTNTETAIRLYKFDITTVIPPILNYATFAGTGSSSTLHYYSSTIDSLPIGNSPRTLQVVLRTTQISSNTCCGGSVVNWGAFNNNNRFGMIVINANSVGNANGLAVGGSVYFCGEFLDISTPQPINDGNWHIVTITYSNPNISIYIDGKIAISSSTPPLFGGTFASLNTIGSYLTIGSDGYGGGGNELYEGDVSRVSVWNTVLTASQIGNISLYTNSFSVAPVTSFLFTGGSNPPSNVVDSLNPNNVLTFN
jgi:hypothetical protein